MRFMYLKPVIKYLVK